MQLKEMLAKTKIEVVGICKGINEYISDKGVTYWSVDVECRGTKMPINIKLPQGYNRLPLVEYDLVTIPCIVKPSFDKKGIYLEALQA